MMKTLTNFGIVLVVLAMVTGNAFASSRYWEGPEDAFASWCDTGNWSSNDIPDDNDDAKIGYESDEDWGNWVVIDGDADTCEGPEVDELIIRTGIVQVGTGPGGSPPNVHVDLTITNDLEMSDDSSGDFSTLRIVNGDVTVNKQSKDVGEDGDILIVVSALSSLTFKQGLYLGDSNGDNSKHTLNIAGDMLVQNTSGSKKRFEQRGGLTTINLIGDGTLTATETIRWSSENDSMMVLNISGNAVFFQDADMEIGKDDDGCDYEASLVVKISGNGKWTMPFGDEETPMPKKKIKIKNDDQILNITVKDNGEFSARTIQDDPAEVNLTVDGAGATATLRELKQGSGKIKIVNGGSFLVRYLYLGRGIGDAYMTVATGANVLILSDLVMGDAGNDSQLTIDGVSMEVGDLEFGTTDGDQWINILGTGELVVKSADDQAYWDIIDDMITAGLIRTTEEGMVVVWDYGIRNNGKLTIRIVKPITVDFKPSTCPNPLRVNFIGQGVFQVAIVGSEDFDVLDVDVATITLQGVGPVRSTYKDISTFGAEVCECTTLGPDGFLDLELKFKREEVLTALEESAGDLRIIDHRTQLPLTLDANLQAPNADVALQGSDCLTILNRGLIKAKK